MTSVTSQVLHAVHGQLLFHTHVEAAALWRAFASTPGLVELVLMPDHVHLLLPPKALATLGPRMSGYARWRNAHRGSRGPVFQARARDSVVSDAKHLRRIRRYFALNPQRKGMTRCPLEWPWSTHRERVGLAWTPIGAAHRDPAWWHTYVSTDQDTRSPPTTLPALRADLLDVDEVVAAYSSLARVPLTRLARKTPDRANVVRLVRALCRGTMREQALRLGVSAPALAQASAPPPGAEALTLRVAGDPRFAGLHSARLDWAAYRHKR